MSCFNSIHNLPEFYLTILSGAHLVDLVHLLQYWLAKRRLRKDGHELIHGITKVRETQNAEAREWRKEIRTSTHVPSTEVG